MNELFVDWIAAETEQIPFLGGPYYVSFIEKYASQWYFCAVWFSDSSMKLAYNSSWNVKLTVLFERTAPSDLPIKNTFLISQS